MLKGIELAFLHDFSDENCFKLKYKGVR